MSARRTYITLNPRNGRTVILPLTAARVRELRRLGFVVESAATLSSQS